MPGFIQNRRLLLPGSASFSPLQLFANGESGAWYDPSDLTTMFQDYAGTAAAVDSPVKLLLDKSQGLVREADVVTNGGFDADSDWTKGTGVTISGGTANFSSVAANQDSLYQNIGAADGEVWEISFDISDFSSGSVAPHFGAINGVTVSANGSYTQKVFCNGNSFLNFKAKSAGTTLKIDNVVARKISGNHAYQDTDSKRPMLRQSGGLYYLEFDGVDDYLQATSVFGTETAIALICAASIRDADANYAAMECNQGGLSGDDDWVLLMPKSNVTATKLRAGIRSASSSVPSTSAESGTANTDKKVLHTIWDGSDITLRINGAESSESASGASITPSGVLTIGAADSDGSILFTAPLDFYGGLAINLSPTAAERQSIDSLLSAKAGI